MSHSKCLFQNMTTYNIRMYLQVGSIFHFSSWFDMKADFMRLLHTAIIDANRLIRNKWLRSNCKINQTYNINRSRLIILHD
jgi:hypothetical protein